MRKTQLLLFLFISFFAINCNRKTETIKKQPEVQLNKKNIVLWQVGVKDDEEVLSFLKQGHANSGQPQVENTCSPGWYDNGYAIEFNCSDQKYYYRHEMWLITYNSVNQTNPPTNVTLTFVGNPNPFTPESITQQPGTSGFKFIYRIPFDAIGVNYCNTSWLTLNFSATSNNCSSPITIFWNNYSASLTPLACASNLQYPPSSLPGSVARTRNLSRITSSCPPCKIPTPNQMVYQYRLVGTTTWSAEISSTSSPFYTVTTPVLAPGNYEFRMQGRCTGGSASAWSAIQPGISTFTIQ
jgi:hypothetical protein